MASFTAPSAPTTTHLSLPGPREVITGERCAALLTELASLSTTGPYEAVVRLSLGDKSYTADGCSAICSSLLSKCINVKYLDLADVIAGRMEAEGLIVLSTFASSGAEALTGLTGLDLSDNAMGLKGIESCMPLFTSFLPTLKELRMCNDGLSHQSMGEVRRRAAPGTGRRARSEGATGVRRSKATVAAHFVPTEALFCFLSLVALPRCRQRPPPLF